MKTGKMMESGKSSSKESQVMHELFENQLKDIYWAEKELTRFMPEIVQKITSEKLISTLEEHMELTKKQVTRLEQVFELIGMEPEAKKSEGMAGLVKEAEEIIESSEEGQIRDAFIIGAVQKVEHYETASYGTLKAMAGLIGEYEVASLLGETLKEEKEADEKLTDVAENIVNIEASREAGDLEDDEEEIEEEDEDFDDDDDDDEELESSQDKSRTKSTPGRRM